MNQRITHIFERVSYLCYKRAEVGKKKKPAKKRIMAPENEDTKEEIIERRLKYSRFQK